MYVGLYRIGWRALGAFSGARTVACGMLLLGFAVTGVACADRGANEEGEDPSSGSDGPAESAGSTSMGGETQGADASGEVEGATASDTSAEDMSSTDGSNGEDGIGVCGDGELDPGEACDDGNQVDGDGCHNDCTRPGTLELEFDVTAVGSLPTAFAVSPKGSTIVFAPGTDSPLAGYLASFDKEGQLEWRTERVDAWIDPEIGQVATDAAGDVYLAEFVFGDVGSGMRTARAVKLDGRDGVELWTRELPPLAGMAMRGAGGSSAGLLAVASSVRNVDLSLGTQVVAHGGDGALVYDTTVPEVSALVLGSGALCDDGGFHLVVDREGGVYELLSVDRRGQSSRRPLVFPDRRLGSTTWRNVRCDGQGRPWVMRTFRDGDEPSSTWHADLMPGFGDAPRVIELEADQGLVHFAITAEDRVVLAGGRRANSGNAVHPWVAMYDVDGHQVWQRDLGVTDRDGTVFDAVLDDDGLLHVLYGQQRGQSVAWVARLRL